MTTQIQEVSNSTGNLRVCHGCRKIAHEDVLDYCPDCNTYICAQCDCDCPVSVEDKAEWATSEAALVLNSPANLAEISV
jgi:uncharacterized paraquat-inducible protein A